MIKKNTFFYAQHGKKISTVFLVIFIASCGFQQYQAKPIQPQNTLENFEKKSVLDERFQNFLIAEGYTAEQLPLKNWDLQALTACALFFHPSLNVARAQWQAAQASAALATEAPLPTINANIAKSNRANGDINPFAYQFSIDLPINTQNKRSIQIESFNHLTEVAKLDIAQTAWHIRQAVANTVIALKWQEAQLLLLDQEIAHKNAIVAMLEKRKNLGLASSVELNQARLQLNASKAAHQKINVEKNNLMHTLAKNIGLPISAVNQMPLNFDRMIFDDVMAKNNPNKIDLSQKNIIEENVSEINQKTALFNRLDVLIALERYAVAENKLKLEIAKQYPDFTISPGYAYEFGDKVWSLGFSGLMAFLKKNKLAILEAEQLREVEIAQFEALQSTIIADTRMATAHLNQTQTQVEQALKSLDKQHNMLRQITKQFNAGEADRLTLVLAQLELLTFKKTVAEAKYAYDTALLTLENTLQTPLLTPNNQQKIGMQLESFSQ